MSQCIFLLLKTIQWGLKSKYGHSYLIVDILGKIYHFSGEISICYLLVLFSIGFGLSSDHIDQEIMVVVGIGVSAIRYLWEILCYFVTWKKHGYHEYEDWVGYVEIFWCFAQALWFVLTWKNVNLVQQKRFEYFMKVIMAIGLVFFMVKPAIIIVVEFLHPENRHLFVFISEN